MASARMRRRSKLPNGKKNRALDRDTGPRPAHGDDREGGQDVGRPDGRLGRGAKERRGARAVGHVESADRAWRRCRHAHREEGDDQEGAGQRHRDVELSLIHISEPTRPH